MQENQPSLVDRALFETEASLIRHFTPMGPEGLQMAAHLVVELRAITWRISVHSDDAALRVWRQLEARGIDVERIIHMTGDWALRINLMANWSELVKAVATSINWMGRSKALPKELVSFNAATPEIEKTLSENWWLLFLYLLANSNASLRLQELMANKIAPLSTKGKPA